MIFADAGPFIARYLSSDQYHHTAVEFWKELERTGETVLTSNLVLAEAFTIIGRRSDLRFAAARLRTIYESPRFTILRSTEADETKAIVYMENHAHLRLSFTDCISFVLMEREAIRRAYTFDEHFRQAGFAIYPVTG